MTSPKSVRTTTPLELTYRHRLNIPFQKSQPNVVERKRIESKPDTGPVLQVQNNKLEVYQEAKRSQSLFSIFEDDDEFEDYLDAELCDALCASQTVFEEPVITAYLSACKKFKIAPNKGVKKSLLEEVLKCRYVSLQYNDCMCIGHGLYNNRFVEKLEFKQNGMGPGPAAIFAEVIKQSSFLTHITLADNGLKSEGAMLICEAVCGNELIRYLDLSGNGFVESDGIYFQKLIKSSESLRELYLGHNELMDEGVKMISKSIKQTYNLRVLDLSWNHIRLQGAVAIGEALRQNTSLEIVNLAWNGLYIDGAKSIAEALKKNSTLEELDLTCNRLSEYCIAQILEGLSYNSTLESLRIGKNHVTTKGAYTILQHVKDIQNSGIKFIDFGKQEVQEAFQDLYHEMKKEREIEVLYGEVWKSTGSSLSNFDANDDERALLCCNPLTVLMECMRLQNMRLIDFFKSLDSDKSNMICINELCDGMLKVGIPIKRETLLRLLKKLDKDNNERIDYGEMVEGQNKHRLYLRKIFANPDIEFERTEVGKVSSLLKKIMGHNFIMKKGDDTRLVTKGPKSRSTSRANSAKSRESGVDVNDKMNISGPDKGGSSSRTSSASSARNSGVHTSHKRSPSLSAGLFPDSSALSDESEIVSRPYSASSGGSEVNSRPGSGLSNSDMPLRSRNIISHNHMLSQNQKHVSSDKRIVSRPNSSSSNGSLTSSLPSSSKSSPRHLTTSTNGMRKSRSPVQTISNDAQFTKMDSHKSKRDMKVTGSFGRDDVPLINIETIGQ